MSWSVCTPSQTSKGLWRARLSWKGRSYGNPNQPGLQDHSQASICSRTAAAICGDRTLASPACKLAYHHPRSSLQTPSGDLPRTPFPLFPSTGPESGSFRNQRRRGETTAQAHALAAGLRECPHMGLHTQAPHPAPAAQSPAPLAWHPPGPSVLVPRLPSHRRFSGIPSKQTFAQDLKSTKATCFCALWSLGRPPASEGLGGQGLHEAGTLALGTGTHQLHSPDPAKPSLSPLHRKGDIASQVYGRMFSLK